MPEQDDLNYSVFLKPPDISAYRDGNTGVDYVHQFDSGKPGPHVMLSAVVHGNELCGAIALDHLLKNKVRPLQGKLTLAFMNVAAFLSFDPENPTFSRFIDEDFNRLWTKDVLAGNRDSVELTCAGSTSNRGHCGSAAGHPFDADHHLSIDSSRPTCKRQGLCQSIWNYGNGGKRFRTQSRTADARL